ncbi:vWA domain-containing protein [Frankia sp. Cas3]|uniref:vWA domain-containing protein n=1 Tax=Frankia sp. Cas3 TaxID=3073926 RepID=UPI002AD35911|nr:vWA domain-containing protein [Frankia sp. Cas3]
MTKTGYTHITLLIDRSGSMMAIRDDAEGGIRSFIAEQAAVPGQATISLYQFDHDYEKVFGAIPIGEAPEYRLVPRGSTALLDALGRSIADTGEFLGSLPDEQRPATVVFAVVTDGQENSSKEWTLEQVKNTISRQTNTYDWQFAFLSADLRAVADARQMGFAPAAAASYSPDGDGVGVAYASLSRSVSRTRASGAPLDLSDS